MRTYMMYVPAPHHSCWLVVLVPLGSLGGHTPLMLVAAGVVAISA